MKRIIVIGSGGAGKSTFATKLGQLLDLQVIHLDKFFWKPGWVESPRDEWLQTVTQLVNRDSWIIDGNYSGTLDVRIQKCDTIIFLDMPRLLCLWRIVKRNVQYRRGARPDMAEGCNGSSTMNLLVGVELFTSFAPTILKLIRANSEEKRVVWLRSNADVRKFLSDPRR